MDYSMLLGIYNVDLADRTQSHVRSPRDRYNTDGYI